MESTSQYQAAPKYIRKGSDTQCIICVENIDLFAIGECGHNQVCWKCALTQRIKLEKKECPICKCFIHKMLITTNKYDTIDTCLTSIFDPESNLWYQNPTIKIDITRKLGFICRLCHQEPVRKFITAQQLGNHYKRDHWKTMCDLCIEHKPVLMFEQKLFDNEHYQLHLKKNHPLCHFCKGLNLYDQDALNKHYASAHHYCEVCKKLGKKRAFKSNNINMPEYEVYKDFTELRNHQQKKHFVCDNIGQQCQLLVFESSAQLASHYLNVHGQQMPVKIEFGNSDSEEEKEDRKEENLKLTKDVMNDRKLFPTLGQANKIMASNQAELQGNQWPSLTAQLTGPSQQSRPQTAAKKSQVHTQKSAPIVVKDRISTQIERKNQEQRRAQARKIASMVDPIADDEFEYNEERDYFQMNQQNVRIIPNQIQSQTATKSKPKKIIVVNERKPEPEEVKSANFEEYPQLAGTRPQTAATQIQTAAWNLIGNERQQQKKDKPDNKTTSFIDKQAFPTLPKDNKPKGKSHEGGGEEGGGGAANKDTTVTKKGRKKNKGQQVMDWSVLEKPIDYKTMF